MFFNELTINIIKTLTNNHVNFKFNNINRLLIPARSFLIHIRNLLIHVRSPLN